MYAYMWEEAADFISAFVSAIFLFGNMSSFLVSFFFFPFSVPICYNRGTPTSRKVQAKEFCQTSSTFVHILAETRMPKVLA